MKTRLRRAGKSYFLRLPARLIAKAGLSEEVAVTVRDGAIIVGTASRPRAGWAEAAKLAHDRNDDRLLDPPTMTHFDRDEWEW